MLRKISASVLILARKKTQVYLSAAFVLALSFSFKEASLFSWISFLPLFFLINNTNKTSAFILSYAYGVIFWAATIYWLANVTLLGTAVLILYLAFYFGVFGLFSCSCFKSCSCVMQLFFIPSLWVILEYVRSYLFTGFPWALLGYSQFHNLAVIQVSDITGVWGVSFFVMLINTGIFILVNSKIEDKQRKKIAFFLIILAIGVFSYGFYQLYKKTNKQNSSGATVCVIQGNIKQELKWNPSARFFIIDKYIGLTKKAALDKPDLIIWPEAANPEILGEGDEVIFPEIITLNKEIKSPLLLGTIIRDRQDEYFNSAILLEDGKISGRYDKLHLVPFGEYIPLKNAMPFLATIAPIGDITAGRQYSVFTTRKMNKDKINFSVLICFEDLFPELSRRFVKGGAEFLVNITNDAWYKKTTAAYQHLQASVFRAIENRIFLVRCANTGISGFISPQGRTISLVHDNKRTNIFIDGIGIENVLLRDTGATFYNRFPNVFVIFCLLILLYGIISPLKKAN